MKSIPTSPSSSDNQTLRQTVPYYYETLAHHWLGARTGLRQALRYLDGMATSTSTEAEAQVWVQEHLEAALRLLEEKWPSHMRQAYDEDRARLEADVQRRQQRHTKVGIPLRRRAKTTPTAPVRWQDLVSPASAAD